MKKRTYKLFLFALFPIAVAAMFLLAYFTDNKFYGAPAPVENGIAALGGTQLRSLAEGWTVYAGLVSPRDAPLAQPVATDVKPGVEPNFSAYLGSPFGAVTYRVAIRGDGEFSLWFPETLSAFRVFLGEEELGGSGTVGDDYRAYVADRIFRVRLQGTTFLTVQVENREAIYGGLYFPPLVGAPEVVSRARSARFGLFVGVFAAIAAILLLTVPVAVFGRAKRRLFPPFCFLCLSTAVSLFHTIAVTLGTGGIAVSYFFQNVGAAAVVLSALVLTARAGGFVNRKSYRFAALPAAIGLLVAVAALSVLAPVSGGFLSASGYLVSAWKLGLSIYLLVISLAAFIKTRAARDSLTLAATATYALCLLLSIATIGFYEPIRGFFPEELGAVAATVAFAALLFTDSWRTVSENERLNRDLTAEVEKKTSALSELMEDRKRLIASLAHDLKTPITAVRTYAELVRENATLDEEAKRGLSVMAARLDDFGERFRLLERFNKVETPPVFAPVDLNAFLANYVQKIREDVELGGAKFSLKLPGETLTVSGDAAKIERALENLVFNALSFTGDGDKIEISLARDGADAAIRVADTGSGISPEDLPSVFEPYFSGRGEFRGLGLYAVKLIVTEHGGTIEAASVPNVKTVFTVRIPLLLS